jgi:hypothetical protein
MRPRRGGAVVVHRRRTPEKLLERVIEQWAHSITGTMTYCVKQMLLSFGYSGPGREVNVVATTVNILGGTPDDMEPVVGHLLGRRQFAFCTRPG